MTEYKRLLEYVKPYWRRVLVAFAAMVVTGALQSAPIPLIKSLLDDVFIGKDAHLLWLLIVLLPVAFTVKGVLFYVQRVMTADIGHRVVRDLRDALYQKYMTLPLAFFTGTHSGDLASRIINDIQLIRSALTDGAMNVVLNGVTILVMLVVIVVMNPKYAPFALLVIPVAGGLIAWFGTYLRRYAKQSQQQTALLSSVLLETINGIRIVKAFSMEKQEIGKFKATNQRIYKLFMKSERISSFSPPLMEWLGALGIAGLLALAGPLVINDKMTTGDFFAFFTAVGLLFQPIKKLNGLNSSVQNGLAAATRIFEIMDSPNPITDPADPQPFPHPMREGVRFVNTGFDYGNASGAKVLDGIDLHVKPGEMVAFVGSSGAGKTSLVNLIPRFYDVTEGSITVDGIDLRDFRVKDLRDRIAIVTQETILFNETISANISYGAASADPEAIRKAAEAANAIGFIEETPRGFETIIGEHGMTISGGQRQRIAIARAILKNAPILILDEATSALDSESEKEVQKAIDKLVENRTTFVIAHRLSTIRNADRIVVLERGRMVEEGSHSALMEKKGAYFHFHNQQFHSASGESVS